MGTAAPDCPSRAELGKFSSLRLAVRERSKFKPQLISPQIFTIEKTIESDIKRCCPLKDLVKMRCEQEGSVPRAPRCTNSGHPLVEGPHFVVCKRDKSKNFLLTIKLRGVKRTSFFDTFQSLPGWCSVRDSSEVTLCIARCIREGQQGSIAKRWSRRTGTSVRGKIESRGVEQFFRLAVSPEPEHRSRAVVFARRPRRQVSKGLKRATGRGEQVQHHLGTLIFSTPFARNGSGQP